MKWKLTQKYSYKLESILIENIWYQKFHCCFVSDSISQKTNNLMHSFQSWMGGYNELIQAEKCALHKKRWKWICIISDPFWTNNTHEIFRPIMQLSYLQWKTVRIRWENTVISVDSGHIHSIDLWVNNN